MAAAVAQQHYPQQSPTPPPLQGPALSLDISKLAAAPIPNKHLPYCSPGPLPKSHQQTPATPPASPPTKHPQVQTPSLLHPADAYRKVSESPPIYSIDSLRLAAALDYLSTQPFPEPKKLFPWLHGLHPNNQVQQAFFIARRKSLRATPTCFRGITIVKADGDLTKSRLKGALAPDELLSPNNGQNATFLDVDPREGFSVRNFHIQATKMAMMSDLVVYGDEDTPENGVRDVAKRLANAQSAWREKHSSAGQEIPRYETFVVSSRFSEFEKNHPELVAIDTREQPTGAVMDFFQWERQEMCNMSKASEIAKNVWLGPSPDSSLCRYAETREEEPLYDVFIEASDLAQAPDPHTLKRIGELSHFAPQHLEFPSSGSIMPPKLSSSGTDPLTEMCQWIHRLANPNFTPDTSDDEQDSDGDIPMKLLSPHPRKIFIHCTDGYTESTLLALAYFMYAERIPVHEAWLRLHCEKKRNFFAYPSDVVLLAQLQSKILELSPGAANGILGAVQTEPAWLSKMDGSLPSRILPYMYLGNLNHANNPELLRAMGINKVLSVGEPVNWTKNQIDSWGLENLLFIDRVQDNGLDPLMKEYEKCLAFIQKGKKDDTATLVHCRVGVSRSATICIAEVMASLALSFPRAYCYVRARRLNVIIQPHLRFAYELLKWDEVQQQKRGEPIKRELEWATIAREIAAMNRPYSR